MSLSEQTKALLDEGIVTEILALIEQDLQEEWKRSSSLEDREKVWHELHALSRVNLKFAAIVSELILQEGRY